MATQTSMEMNDSDQNQINNTIVKMQSCAQELWGALFFQRWKRLGFIFFCLIMFVSAFYGILICVCVVFYRCKLPSPDKPVKELDRLAIELKYKVNILKQKLENERNTAWFPSLNSRWRSLDELEKLAKDVVGLVFQLQSETHSELISLLKEKLHKCQELVKKI